MSPSGGIHWAETVVLFCASAVRVGPMRGGAGKVRMGLVILLDTTPAPFSTSYL